MQKGIKKMNCRLYRKRMIEGHYYNTLNGIGSNSQHTESVCFYLIIILGFMLAIACKNKLIVVLLRFTIIRKHYDYHYSRNQS